MQAMRTLWVTGAAGVLGGQVLDCAHRQGRFDRVVGIAHHSAAAPAHHATTWLTLDIGDVEAVRNAADASAPDVIINAAAMTNVDACETHPTEAQRANAEGPRILAEVAQAYHSHLIHVSTDYVFPGDDVEPGPYRESDAPRAISVYGATKLAGERAIAEVCGAGPFARFPAAIVRTAIVYGLGARTNFVTWLARELGAGRRVRIVRDQFNTPTLADDLAALLLWMADEGTTGTYHAAGPDLLGRHEWALQIAHAFDLNGDLIDWVTTAELGQAAARPLRSGLRCERLAADQAHGAPAMRGTLAGLRDIPWMA